MPYYDFRCLGCGEEFETQMGMEEKAKGAKVTCTSCGQAKVQQIYRPLGVVRKTKSKGPNCPPAGCCSGGMCGHN